MHPLRKNIQQLVAISDEEWEALWAACEEIQISKQDYFIRAGRYEQRIGFILEGSMRQYYPLEDKGELTTYFFFENNLVSAYVSCILKQPSPLSIQALEDTRLIVFPYPHLEQLFERYPQWQLFGRKIAEYLLAGTEERMVGLLADNPETRYRKLLNSPQKQKILERVPQHLIANYLGITPISLSRIRNRIQH